jgi:HSP20 family protein
MDLVRDFHRILLSSEVRELSDEVSRLFEDLDKTRAGAQPSHGHCAPPLDVLQTESTVEVVADLPGVAADRLRIMLKNGVLILVGEKPSPYTAERPDGSFHLVERGFGRFARAVHLEGAIDGGAARAVLAAGELRVVVPKIVERRGQEISVPVTTS